MAIAILEFKTRTMALFRASFQSHRPRPATEQLMESTHVGTRNFLFSSAQNPATVKLLRLNLAGTCFPVIFSSSCSVQIAIATRGGSFFFLFQSRLNLASPLLLRDSSLVQRSSSSSMPALQTASPSQEIHRESHSPESRSRRRPERNSFSSPVQSQLVSARTRSSTISVLSAQASVVFSISPERHAIAGICLRRRRWRLGFPDPRRTQDPDPTRFANPAQQYSSPASLLNWPICTLNQHLNQIKPELRIKLETKPELTRAN